MDHKQQKLLDLLSRPDIWQASQAKIDVTAATPSDIEAGIGRQAIKTGYQQLDGALQYNGWPAGKLIECLSDNCGEGELQLFTPAIKWLSHSQQQASPKNSAARQVKPVLLIAPPYQPYSIGWQQHGIHSQCLWVVSAPSLKKRLWATQQALASGCCAAVLCWLQQHKLHNSELRKLQLAAQRGNGIAVLFRNICFRHHHSAASLRLAVSTKSPAEADKLSIDIIKQPGNWGGQHVTISKHKQILTIHTDAANWPVYSPAAQHHVLPAHDNWPTLPRRQLPPRLS